jgi:hypothetical protein
MSVLIDLKTGDPESAGARFQLAAYVIAYQAGQGDRLTFDAADHTYRVRATGARVPSVTQILKAVGVSVDFDDLREMGVRMDHDLERKRQIGTALHADAHAFDDQDLNWSTVHPDVRPYLEAWVAFRQAYPALRPATRERVVYSPAYQFAGTLDAIFLIDGESQVEITERWAVQLTPELRIPYRVTPYNEHPWLDDDKFKAFVVTYYEGHARRRAA